MMTAVAQFVRDRFLKPAGATRAGHFREVTWSRLERALAWVSDPLVTYRIGGASLKLPLSHALPRIRKYCVHYGLNVGRIGEAVAHKYPEMTAIDVGANVGDTLAIMRARATYPILCVEAEERFFGILRENVRQFPDVAIARAYLGEVDEDVEARLDVSKGTAVLRAGAGTGTVRVQTLATLLREFPAFSDAKLLKIDTDGFDVKIILGARALLSAAKPVVFFEYDPHFLSVHGDGGLRVFPALREAGYRQLLVYDNFGVVTAEIDLADEAGLAEMHRQNTGLGGGKYVDLCAFHERDSDLFEGLARSERAATAAAGSPPT
jgi:FkbM family methyltransferase